jgi:FKBP-type peptidyl-prolyl cis-trans isomerase
LILAPALWGCKKQGDVSSLLETTFDKDASYALGMNIGFNMAKDDISPDLDEVLKGMRDVLAGTKPRLDELEAQMKLEQAFFTLFERKNSEAVKIETAFLAENSKKPGVLITASGLQYEIIDEGGGEKPQAADIVKIHYHGMLIDGTVFDTSTWGEPVEFPLVYGIPGWIEGIQLMSVGSKYKFYIPSELAYGPQGREPIPPHSPLIFEVELFAIVRE